jgi:AcrR family transcriptional regulator
LTQEKPLTRGQARRQAMLDAATDLFLEKGYERTSLTDIVDRSKGSRTTLYEQFGNKEGLLRAMVEDSSSRLWQVIDSPDETPSFAEAELVDLGRRFITAALAPNAVAVFRIVVAEGHRVPDIAEFFFDRGPRIIKERLTQRFRLASAGSPLAIGSPEVLTQVFLGAVIGDLWIRQALGLAPLCGDEEIEAHVRIAVRIFLDGIARSVTDQK